MLALEGIKILDLTYQGPGPFATFILGDMGADILRIGPPPTSGTRLTVRTGTTKDAAYSASNRNKKSLLLNLRAEEGRQVFYKLAKDADVIVEGFRPGVAQRLGVDYATVARINPKIVYCSVSGYGQDGPYRDLPGHDVNYISFGGALGLIGEADKAPVIPLNLVADYGAGGKDAVIGIITALYARKETGRGQYVDISLTDSVISLLTQVGLDVFFRSGMEPKRGEMSLSGAFPHYAVYQTKDGKFISLGCLEPWLWESLCQAIGKEDFSAYTVASPALDRRQEIASYLKQLFLTRTRDEWFELLKDKNVPIGKVYSLAEVFTDPQVLHRQMVIEVEHPEEGKVKQVGIAIKLSDTPGKVRSFAATAGENTDAVLKELGYKEAEIRKLHETGVVG